MGDARRIPALGRDCLLGHLQCVGTSIILREIRVNLVPIEARFNISDHLL